MYRFLKIIVPVILRIFYRRVRVFGKEFLEDDGPMIVVSNHPNTLMDPVVVASVVKPQIGFLGKATLFSNKIARSVLNYFKVIPIYRKIDEKITGTMDNSKSFEKCYEFLEKGGVLLIFPEGTSYAEMKLRDLKTGTARIGFEVEERNNWKTNIKILPISLNYSDPSRFRTEVTVNITPAIYFSEYEEQFKSDPKAAVDAVTERIRKRLIQEMVIVDNKEDEALLKKVNTIYGRRLLETLPEEKDRKSRFRVLQAIGQAIEWLRKKDPERLADITEKVNDYYDLVDRLKLRQGFVSSRFQRWNPTLLFSLHLLYLIIGFPIYAFGLLTNFIPYLIPAKVAEKMTHEIEFWSSIMMMVGMIVFPIYYAAEIVGFHLLFGHIKWATLIFGLSIPLAGLFTLDYWLRLGRFVGIWRLFQVGGRKGNMFVKLKEKKEKLLKELEVLREEFLRG